MINETSVEESLKYSKRRNVVCSVFLCFVVFCCVVFCCVKFRCVVVCCVKLCCGVVCCVVTNDESDRQVSVLDEVDCRLQCMVYMLLSNA